MVFTPKIHKYLYFFGLIIFAGFLNLSEYILSISMFILIINWLLEADFQRKFRVIKANKGIMLFPALFLLAVLSLLYTNNLDKGFRVLRIWLPLLFIPAVIGTSEKLSYKELKVVLIFFLAGLFISTCVSYAILFGLTNKTITDTRNISYFFSHIRFSLMIVLGIFIAGYFVFKDKSRFFKGEKLLYSFLILWFIPYLFILKALTGVVVFFVLLLFILSYFVFTSASRIVKTLFISLVIVGIGGISYYVFSIYKDYYSTNVLHTGYFPTTTERGNGYYHIIESEEKENGYYVWRFICDKELKKEWNERSTIDYDSLDNKEQRIRHTIIRYMTSMGLKKDSIGLSKLTEQDINAIENGYTNKQLTNKFSLYPRVYELIWELDQYARKGKPAGSLSRRIVSYEAAIQLIKDNFIFGTGIGDMNNEYRKYYEKNIREIEKSKFVFGHNQYLSIFVTLGMIGFFLFVFMLFYPFIRQKGYKNYFFMVYFITALLSMMNDDTINTQIGMAFFIFFYALLLFGYDKTISKDHIFGIIKQ
jgi:MFS family permease